MHLIQNTRLGMGTIIRISLEYPSRNDAYSISELAFQNIDRIETLMSVFKPKSEIARLNAHGFVDDVSADTRNVLTKSKYYSKVSRGIFDVTIGPVLKILYECDPRSSRINTELNSAASLVNSDDIVISDNRIWFAKSGMSVNLGAIAKGYAVDVAVDILRINGVQRAIVDAGGDIKVIGGRSDAEPWRIGVRNPHKKLDDALIYISDMAVATSGTYYRRINDIINPRNAHHTTTLERTTVVASDAADADALSTVLHILGVDQGMKFIDKFEGTAALLLSKEGDLFKSKLWGKLTGR